jgi:hypothetical protein
MSVVAARRVQYTHFDTRHEHGKRWERLNKTMDRSIQKPMDGMYNSRSAKRVPRRKTPEAGRNGTISHMKLVRTATGGMMPLLLSSTVTMLSARVLVVLVAVVIAVVLPSLLPMHESEAAATGIVPDKAVTGPTETGAVSDSNSDSEGSASRASPKTFRVKYTSVSNRPR